MNISYDQKGHYYYIEGTAICSFDHEELEKLAKPVSSTRYECLIKGKLTGINRDIAKDIMGTDFCPNCKIENGKYICHSCVPGYCINSSYFKKTT